MRCISSNATPFRIICLKPLAGCVFAGEQFEVIGSQTFLLVSTQAQTVMRMNPLRGSSLVISG
jgi:hypothetical protein